MKRIIQAVVVAVLFTGAQAKAEDAPIVLPSQWTHADRAAPQAGMADAFAGSIDEMLVLNSRDGSPASGSEKVADAFPGSAREDPIVVESMSTYADGFKTERSQHARGASDPALSQ